MPATPFSAFQSIDALRDDDRVWVRRDTDSKRYATGAQLAAAWGWTVPIALVAGQDVVVPAGRRLAIAIDIEISGGASLTTEAGAEGVTR
ncbi:MAG: hypothetical protein GC168_20680 [Candidatus Hydrogenedens sp.]|nr:hypothetical protein [Candidatus Hydrogenedens sp.]